MWGIFNEIGLPAFAAMAFAKREYADGFLSANLPNWTRIETIEGNVIYVRPDMTYSYIIKPIIFVEATEI